ncbi:MAG: heavy-metal-associated domain-containing protein [Candidatus Scalindua sp.]|nr:heavy-metal-associated domain-containing protein [Candidatus Scalindua sp.]
MTTLWSVAVRAEPENAAYTLQVDGLVCPFCTYGLEKKLLAIESVETVEIDLKTGTVTIKMQDDVSLDEKTTGRAVDAAGFTMRNFKKERDAE